MNRHSRVQDRLDGLYHDWLRGVSGEARRGQRHMMRAIAETFLHEPDGERLAVIEAGTGTGKTLAYLLAGSVCADELDKTLVVATSTVMLQEQVLRELGNIASHTALDIKAGVVKGRGRYLCPLKLDQKRASAQGELSLEEDAPEGRDAHSDSSGLVLALAEAWHAGTWDGDRDNWGEALPTQLWRELTNSRVGCLRDRCAHFRVCPFFLARDASREFDLMVVNQDLLLADLSLGGGVILPKLEDAVIVIDEAHHLAEKARRWASCAADPGGLAAFVHEVGQTLGATAGLLGEDPALRESVETFAERQRLLASPEGLLIDALSRLQFETDRKETGLCYFDAGQLPDELRVLCEELSAHLRVMAEQAWKFVEAMESELDELPQNAPRARHEALLIELREQASSLDAQSSVMLDFSPPPERPQDAPPTLLEQRVRWSIRNAENGGAHRFGLRSAPLFPGDRLHGTLWSQAYGVVCTSATLRGMGSFDTFKLETGIGDGARLEHIESSFPYRDMVTLRIPRRVANPRDGRAHTGDIAKALPDLMREERSGLILFTSWRQLFEVQKRLPAKVRKQLLVQDSFAAARLVETHKHAIDSGKRSYLMGVASLAEGLDLRDEYCRHVIIARLPFMVPTDPVERALREWYEAQNEDAFRALSLPYASLKLRQACGRLIRNENDYGRITLLDSRAANSAWGREIVDSLPAYRVEFC